MRFFKQIGGERSDHRVSIWKLNPNLKSCWVISAVQLTADIYLISKLLCGWRIVTERKGDFPLTCGAIQENCNVLKKPQKWVTDFRKPDSISSVHIFSVMKDH